MGRKSKREGIYVNVWLIHFVGSAETNNIVKQLYSKKKKINLKIKLSQKYKKNGALQHPIFFPW